MRATVDVTLVGFEEEEEREVMHLIFPIEWCQAEPLPNCVHPGKGYRPREVVPLSLQIGG